MPQANRCVPQRPWKRIGRALLHGRDAGAAHNAAPGGRSEFRLQRYFALAGLAAFLIVAILLYVLEQRENEYFRSVQLSHRAFVSQIQDAFARQQDEAARRDLLSVHETGHANLARLLANALWSTHVEPLAAKAGRIPIERCHALGAAGAPAMADCFAAIGKTIAALPEFGALDARVAATIKSTSVFKIKVFDLRGITIYSSEHAQVGEDKYNNQGWRMAAGGHAASELTHRDRFSAFEGVVENRDLISSYVPVTGGDNGKVAGVFEIYSDVTPLLAQIKAAFEQSGQRAAANQARLGALAAENQTAVEAASRLLIAAVAVLLAVLYGALLLIVRHGQRILDAQAQAQAQYLQREDRWHHEKMSALAAMAATVAHEIGNPLAVISALADAPQDAAAGDMPAQIREQVGRIAAKTRQITDFAAARSETREPVDVNPMVRAVCDFLAYERSFRSTRIEFKAAAQLPLIVIIPDHLTEVLMNLLQACVDHGEPARPAPRLIRVESLPRENGVALRVTCDTLPVTQWVAGPFHDPRMAATRRRIAGLAGTLAAAGDALELVLPAQP